MSVERIANRVFDTDKMDPDEIAVAQWGTWSGQYTYDLVWNGVPITVEAEVPTFDPDSIDVVRVLAGGVDITEIVDTTHGHLCDLLANAHANRHYPDLSGDEP